MEAIPSPEAGSHAHAEAGQPFWGGEARHPLQPLIWRPLEPLPAAPADAAADAEPPLLLQIDRRDNDAETVQQQLLSCLTEHERQRHDGYRFPADRQRFLLGRGGLRRLLGIWLGLPAEAVPLVNGPHGKPHCPGGPAFNVSHSGDLILLAVHPCRPVGVDVESQRPALDWQALARRLFSPAEQTALETWAPAQRPAAFLAAWCRLEARLKARGGGLGGLEALRAEERRGPISDGEDERIWEVSVPAGYRAAVALAPVALAPVALAPRHGASLRPEA